MSKDIQKSNSKIQKKNRPHPDWKTGDIILDTHRSDDPERLKIIKLTNKGITYARWCHYIDDEDETKEWWDWDDSPSTYEWEEFEYYHSNCIKLEKDWKEYEKETLEKLQSTKDLEEHFGLGKNTDETQLATSGNKDILFAAKTELERRKNTVEIMRVVLQDKVNTLEAISRNFREQIQKVEKVIGVVELYLGVHEEIYQIQEGAPTDPKEPICIRQQLLYMDEEIGDPTNGGLDFQKLEDWDNWVVVPKNLQQVLPEKKGVVAIRVRREDKCYASGGTIGDAFINATLNQKNHKTYFLIRNGDNIYRIWSNITVDPRLFPTKKELNYNPEESSKRIIYWNKEAKEEQEFEYKKYGLFLQGLLHRTLIFQPLSKQLHIFQPETWEGMLNFIQDDELMLPSGRLSWRGWQEEINSKIQEGSRIIYILSSGHWEKNFMEGRVAYQYRHTHPPEGGIYIARKSPNANNRYERGDGFRFLYNPGGDVWTINWDGTHDYHKRKNRISFTFYMDEVLNYDQISLEDIEFYINCRTERKNYLKMMPLLYRLKRKRLEELEREKLFVQLVVNRNNVSEDKVWKLVDWWKYKNKWKRPIDKDDAKALRMIERKLK